MSGRTVRFLSFGFLCLLGAGTWVFAPDQKDSLLEGVSRIQTISDRSFGGSSEVERSNADTGLSFRYALSPGLPHPWAGIKLELARGETGPMDFLGWDRLEIRARSVPARAVRIQILSHDQTRSTNARDSLHPIYHALEYVPDGTPIAFPWAAFSVPSWWRAQNSRAEVQRLDLLDRTQAIEFHSGDSPSGTDRAAVHIQSLDLVRRDPRFIWAGRLLLALGFFGIALGIRKAKAPPSPQTPNPPSALVPQPVVLDDPRSRQASQVLQALRENFSDPELSLESFSSKLAMPSRLVAALLKEATQLHFKGALNELRLTEAARLLGQSQANISEIAFAVGYQNLSHFGRAFREKFGVSPSEFRAGKSAPS